MSVKDHVVLPLFTWIQNFLRTRELRNVVMVLTFSHSTQNTLFISSPVLEGVRRNRRRELYVNQQNMFNYKEFFPVVLTDQWSSSERGCHSKSSVSKLVD